MKWHPIADLDKPEWEHLRDGRWVLFCYLPSNYFVAVQWLYKLYEGDLGDWRDHWVPIYTNPICSPRSSRRLLPAKENDL